MSLFQKRRCCCRWHRTCFVPDCENVDFEAIRENEIRQGRLKCCCCCCRN